MQIRIPSSPRTLTFTSSNMLDVDAIKTHLATVAAITAYSGAALNGVVPSTGLTLAGFSEICQYPSVTCTNVAGAYVANSTVLFTGTYGGEAVVRTATITSTAGNGTYIADGPIDVASCTQIVIAAQANTNGDVSFGLTDMACPKKYGQLVAFTGVRAASGGNVAVVYPGGYADTLVLAAAESDYVLIERIVQASTNVGIRVYF